MRGDVVIVGGGLAAVRTAQGLRDLGFEGTILLISDEERLPYDRPPLSKDFLLGRATDDDICLLGSERVAELDVELSLGRRAEGLQPEARRVVLADGAGVEYDKLVVATGSRANRLPALDGLEGVVYLRTAGDARVLRNALAAQPREFVAVLGGPDQATAVFAMNSPWEFMRTSRALRR